MKASIYDVHRSFIKRTIMKHVYIASPWFTPEQNTLVEDLKRMMDIVNLSYYSPKDECLFDPKNPDPEGILGENISAISECKYVFAVTDGKDPGTLWECGYAFAIGKPIVYIWLNHVPGQKFNIVLSASGVKVCMTLEEIQQALTDMSINGDVLPSSFKGEME